MTGRTETVRVFVAVDLPAPAKDTLRQTVLELSEALPTGIRWVDPAGIHLTLKFLGDVEAARVDALLDSMERAAGRFAVSSLSLSLSGLGVFPNAREPRVLWAGVEGQLEALRQLQLLVDEEISKMGFVKEHRPFRPHLTLGRVRDQVPQVERYRIGQVMRKAALVGSHAWEAGGIHLIRSTLTPTGAIYNSIGVRQLKTGQ